MRKYLTILLIIVSTLGYSQTSRVSQMHSLISVTVPIDSAKKWSLTATRIDLFVPKADLHVNFNYFGIQYSYAKNHVVQILAGTAHNTGPNSPQSFAFGLWGFGSFGKFNYGGGMEYYPESTFPWYDFAVVKTSIIKALSVGIYHEAGGAIIGKNFGMAGPFIQISKNPINVRFIYAYDWVQGKEIIRPSLLFFF